MPKRSQQSQAITPNQPPKSRYPRSWRGRLIAQRGSLYWTARRTIMVATLDMEVGTAAPAGRRSIQRVSTGDLVGGA
eukprot:1944830-Rhodomonas_salina.5